MRLSRLRVVKTRPKATQPAKIYLALCVCEDTCATLRSGYIFGLERTPLRELHGKPGAVQAYPRSQALRTKHLRINSNQSGRAAEGSVSAVYQGCGEGGGVAAAPRLNEPPPARDLAGQDTLKTLLEPECWPKTTPSLRGREKRAGG